MKKVKFKETAYKWAKGATLLGVSVGTGIIVKNIVKNNVPESEKKITELCVNITTFALTSYVSNKLTTHMDEKIDKTRKDFEDLMNVIAEVEEEEEDEETVEKKDVHDSFNNLVDSIAKGVTNE